MKTLSILEENPRKTETKPPRRTPPNTESRASPKHPVSHYSSQRTIRIYAPTTRNALTLHKNGAFLTSTQMKTFDAKRLDDSLD